MYTYIYVYRHTHTHFWKVRFLNDYVDPPPRQCLRHSLGESEFECPHSGVPFESVLHTLGMVMLDSKAWVLLEAVHMSHTNPSSTLIRI